MSAKFKAFVDALDTKPKIEEVVVQYGNPKEYRFHLAPSTVLSVRDDGAMLVTHDDWIGVAIPLHDGNRSQYPKDVEAVCTQAIHRMINIKRHYGGINGLLRSFGFDYLIAQTEDA